MVYEGEGGGAKRSRTTDTVQEISKIVHTRQRGRSDRQKERERERGGRGGWLCRSAEKSHMQREGESWGDSTHTYRSRTSKR